MRCEKEIEKNLASAEAKIREAAKMGAQIILLPELFEREYFCQQDVASFFTPMQSRWRKMTRCRWECGLRGLSVVLPISFYERNCNNLYNSVACIDADGTLLSVYRKTHIPDDHFTIRRNSISRRGHRISGVCHEIRHDRCRHLLGSSGFGERAMHGVKGRGTAVLSDRDRIRA